MKSLTCLNCTINGTRGNLTIVWQHPPEGMRATLMLEDNQGGTNRIELDRTNLEILVADLLQSEFEHRAEQGESVVIAVQPAGEPVEVFMMCGAASAPTTGADGPIEPF